MTLTKPVYPIVPERRRFTIGETARLACRHPHVLRYWEREIPPLANVERRNGRRYYNRGQVLMVQQIARLLDDGVSLSAAWGRVQDGDGGAVRADWLRGELQKVLDIL